MASPSRMCQIGKPCEAKDCIVHKQMSFIDAIWIRLLTYSPFCQGLSAQIPISGFTETGVMLSCRPPDGAGGAHK